MFKGTLRAVTVSGTLFTAAALTVCIYFVVGSQYGPTILCSWGRTCDGGDSPVLYRAALTSIVAADAPAYLLSLLMPRADDTAAYIAWSVAVLVVSCVWWFVVGLVFRQAKASPKIAATTVAATFLIAGAMGSVALGGSG